MTVEYFTLYVCQRHMYVLNRCTWWELSKYQEFEISNRLQRVNPGGSLPEGSSTRSDLSGNISVSEIVISQ